MSSDGPGGPGVAAAVAGASAGSPADAEENRPPTGPITGAIPAQREGARAEAYKIGAGDVLNVSVFKVPELNNSVQVADNGFVSLPLVGEIKAAGRTPNEVAAELTQKLGAKYLQSPQVSVLVKEYNSQRISIDGAVKKPGVFPYRSSITLLEVIAMADGLDPNSDASVVVFRDADGQRSAARFDVSEIRAGNAEDPAVRPGDKIVVGSSMIKSAFNNVLKALPVAGLFLGL